MYNSDSAIKTKEQAEKLLLRNLKTMYQRIGLMFLLAETMTFKVT